MGGDATETLLEGWNFQPPPSEGRGVGDWVHWTSMVSPQSCPSNSISIKTSRQQSPESCQDGEDTEVLGVGTSQWGSHTPFYTPCPFHILCLSSIQLFTDILCNILYNKPVDVRKAPSSVLWAILGSYWTQGVAPRNWLVTGGAEAREAWTWDCHVKQGQSCGTGA